MDRNVSVRFLARSTLSSVAIVTLLTGCGGANKAKAPLTTGSITRQAPATVSQHNPIKKRPMLKASKHVQQATKLSKAFEKNPANSKLALNYIYTLRSLGMHQQAVNILHKAYQANPKHPVIASEYGRLLLGTGKALQAGRVLGRIDDKRTARDWRTLSALGTIEARNGKYEKATKFFQKAHNLAPKQASIINNLALSMALGGRPDEAENLLRNADDSGRFGARLRQNLALVLALQGKYNEAQEMATTDLSPAKARKNIAYLKRMLSTTDMGTGVEFTDETMPPVANARMSTGLDGAPVTTGSVGAPTSLTPQK